MCHADQQGLVRSGKHFNTLTRANSVLSQGISRLCLQTHLGDDTGLPDLQPI